MYSRDKQKYHGDKPQPHGDNYRYANKNYKGSSYQQNYNKSPDHSHDEAPGSFNDGSTIYVANISSEVHQADFERFFGKFGNIVFSTLKKDHVTGSNKGFGFIKYESSNFANKAIVKSNGIQFFGKKIYVELSKKSYKYDNRYEHDNQGKNSSRSPEKMRERNFQRKPSNDSYNREKFRDSQRYKTDFNQDRHRKRSEDYNMDKKNSNYENYKSKEKREVNTYENRGDFDKMKPKYKGIGSYTKNKDKRHSNSRSMDPKNRRRSSSSNYRKMDPRKGKINNHERTQERDGYKSSNNERGHSREKMKYERPGDYYEFDDNVLFNMIMRSDPEQRGFYEKQVLNAHFGALMKKENVPFQKAEFPKIDRERSRERSYRNDKDRKVYKEKYEGQRNKFK